ncbi:MAG TPA: DEAD/DEAH box helicase family protein [Anaerolineales bacterium]|nr:DEAD/DEAH box helicase family protein [Anaerolineales bacterium]
MTNLHNLLNDVPFEDLPATWTTFNLASFSRGKSLWDYQQSALQSGLKALHKYYKDFEGSKPSFFQWYIDNQIELDADLNLGKKRDNESLLAPYYPIADNKIPYQHFINRMGFWMATGSGKTLVIVKMLEVLHALIQRKEIPAHDVMVLTHREDLLQQLRDHVNEYNKTNTSPYIHLKELREYPEYKRGTPSMFGGQDMTVFYYRSDNLSDEQKERLIDFHNYENNGKWYLLLDEAHKGDKDDSKRQHIYNIMSRNGFLFNFSATFTDPRDIKTTASEFNLASFIEKGYGKHISLLKQENRAFKKNEEFNEEEKQRIVLQSLLMLAYIAKSRENLCDATSTSLYHRPLLLALVNSVNTEEADLKLFFRELERIGKGEISTQAFTAAKQALKAELESEPEWLYEDKKFALDQSLFNSLNIKDVHKYIFNAESKGDIEVLVRPSNDKELAFRLKTSTTGSPFALIKIGQTAEWMKGFLAGYEIVQGFEDESFFARLNEEDSEINLLMGSRSFYEGWDSNRPNVITFINIGTGSEARKFVLQSVGRGVRIEPMKGKRKRLENLHNANEVDDMLFGQAKPFLAAVQSLFIFGTKREALETIFEGLAQEKEKEEGVELELSVNPDAISNYPVLIPVYRKLNGHLLVEQHDPRKFEIQASESALLKQYVEYLGDERLLLARHGMTPQQIGLLDETLKSPDSYFNPNTQKKYGNINLLLPRLTQYFGLIPQEVEGFKPLEDEINHFKHIRVLLKDLLEELKKKIEAVRLYKDPADAEKNLKKELKDGTLDIDAYTLAVKNLARTEPSEIFEHNGQRLHIKNIASHYYLPLLVSNDDRLDYISRVIKVESERKFVNQLEAYIKDENHLLNQYDWWMFSRAEETLDKLTIPYYDPTSNKMRDFHPDFVFWLVKGNEYTVLFVDPKGFQNTGYQYKVDGYKDLFREKNGKHKIFKRGKFLVRVALSLYTDDSNQPPAGYREFWYDNPKRIFENL